MSDGFAISTLPGSQTDVTCASDELPTLPPNEDDLPECRICRESTGTLMAFTCRCNTLVHAACLRRWQGYRADALFPLLSSTARNLCEICRHPVNLSKSISNVEHMTTDSSSSPSSSSAAAAATSLPTNTFTSTISAKYESCCLLPRAVTTYMHRMCEDAFTVESCLFIFLLVLAVMGHALFVLSIYKGAEKDEHSLKRVCLAAANALVTLSLLILVQKLASRWLRETDSGETIVSVPRTIAPATVTDEQLNMDDESIASRQSGDPSNRSEYTRLAVADVEAQVREYRAYATRCTTFSQVILGAFLSVIAAAEIFFLVRELPLGGLA